MSDTINAVQHRVCGHIAGAAHDRAQLEHRLEHLHAAGYHQWRLRTVPTDDALVQLVADAKCDTCRIDPVRGLSLLGETGQCRVCHPAGRP
jgi:hypothetical protein